MPSFSQHGEFFVATLITGPSSAMVRIRFTDVENAVIVVNRLAPETQFGDPRESSLRDAVLEGVASANTKNATSFKVAEIQYQCDNDEKCALIRRAAYSIVEVKNCRSGLRSMFLQHGSGDSARLGLFRVLAQTGQIETALDNLALCEDQRGRALFRCTNVLQLRRLCKWCGKRASDKGFLGMSFELYLNLLDWTGRQICRDFKKGRIPADLAPIMERVGLLGELWCDLVKRFGKIFKRVAGRPESLAQNAILHGQSGYRTVSSPLPSAG